MELDNIIGHLILGTILILLGVVILLRKNARVGLGGGRTAGSPLWVIEINGTAAIVLAVFTILGGMIISIPFAMVILGSVVSEDLLFGLPILGMLTLVGGFFFSLVTQAIVSAKETTKTDGKHPLEHFQNQDS